MDAKTQETKTSTSIRSEDKEEQDLEQGVKYFQSPRDFYEEISQRPDIKKILAKLAKK